MNICVFGAASREIDMSYVKSVEAFGDEMGRRGHTLVFGAGKYGLMGAAARGVKNNGGTVYGVIPRFFTRENIEPVYEKCDDLTLTDTMAERKTKMEDLAEAFVIVPGGIGTLEEFFQVLTLKQLGRHCKPIAIFDINGYYKHLEKFLEVSIKEKFINANCSELYFYSDDIKEILDYLENDARERNDVHDFKLS